ncbi:late histone H1-like [Mizuhopecten yessoensis]|uniref:Histone H1.2 n=1 Tax=Mizuhopecten yessoensis TaxID=6573 RepID=A0A210PTC5_MIZYE|nr:late histone H1-like [Mizuhopecten yessoensis]OWF39757.1 Histone H1.2 [Mizuhopecten yessoensis]
MSDAVSTSPVAKVAKKVSKPKVAPAHPTYAVMISAAIAALQEKGGSSKQKILAYIMANYKVGTEKVKINSRVRLALKSCVVKGTVSQAKGTGASGSFKLGEKPKVAKKEAKKPAAKKVKKPKKVTVTKPTKTTTTNKKTPKKAAKKPAAKKTAAKNPAATKVKTPKKATKKPAAKKPAVKKPAKKTAAKK